MVNVGLLTFSLIPKAKIISLTKVVLPVPRSPSKKTINADLSFLFKISLAISCPRFFVSSKELKVSFLFIKLLNKFFNNI